MAEAATTRVSLLIRLRDNADSEAWSRFVDIYSPLIFGFARRCRLQDSDAADLVQEVMGEVAKSIGRFEYDPQVGKFRSWLYRIAKRTVSKSQQKQMRQPTGAGDSQAVQILNSYPDQRDELQQFWDNEYQKHLIDWATTQIRGHFRDDTWNAFWLTSVEERSPQDVADMLGLGIGSVYVAKSRVMKRLAEKIREIDDSF